MGVRRTAKRALVNWIVVTRDGRGLRKMPHLAMSAFFFKKPASVSPGSLVLLLSAFSSASALAAASSISNWSYSSSRDCDD